MSCLADEEKAALSNDSNSDGGCASSTDEFTSLGEKEGAAELRTKKSLYLSDVLKNPTLILKLNGKT